MGDGVKNGGRRNGASAVPSRVPIKDIPLQLSRSMCTAIDHSSNFQPYRESAQAESPQRGIASLKIQQIKLAFCPKVLPHRSTADPASREDGRQSTCRNPGSLAMLRPMSRGPHRPSSGLQPQARSVYAQEIERDQSAYRPVIPASDRAYVVRSFALRLQSAASRLRRKSRARSILSHRSRRY
jgi:hypothetical protein